MIKVAVYGSLRRGFGNYHYYLANQTFLGQEVVNLPMGMVSLGAFPGLVKSDSNNEIVIEVFDVDEETFRGVDGLEGYPRFYDRKQIDTTFGKAWIYFLANEDSYGQRDFVPEGDWKKFLHSKRIQRNEILSED